MTEKRAVHISFPKNVLDEFSKVCVQKGVSLGTGLRRLAAYSGERTWMPPKMHHDMHLTSLATLAGYKDAINLDRDHQFGNIIKDSEQLSRQALVVSPQNLYFERGINAVLNLSAYIFAVIDPILEMQPSVREIQMDSSSEETQYKIIAELLNQVGYRKFFRMAKVIAANKTLGKLSVNAKDQLKTIHLLVGSMIQNVHAIYVRAGRVMIALNLHAGFSLHPYTKKITWHRVYHEFLVREAKNNEVTFPNAPLRYIFQHDGATVSGLEHFNKFSNYIVPSRSDACMYDYEAMLLRSAFLIMILTHRNGIFDKPFSRSTVIYDMKVCRDQHTLFSTEADYLVEMIGILKHIRGKHLLNLLGQTWGVVKYINEHMDTTDYDMRALVNDKIGVQVRYVKRFLSKLSPATIQIATDSIIGALEGRMHEVDHQSSLKFVTAWSDFVNRIQGLEGSGK